MRKFTAVALFIGSTLLSGCNFNSAASRMSTEDLAVQGENEPLKVLYAGNLQSEKMFCFMIVNDMQQVDNLSTNHGDAMTGANLTAFLEPGNNELQAFVAPADMYEGGRVHRDNGTCTISAWGASPEGQKTELTSINVTVEEKTPTAKYSKLYDSKHRSPLSDPDGTFEGYGAGFKRNLYVHTIPVWRWTQAPKFEPTKENMQQLQAAYMDLLSLLREKDFAGLEAAWSLSSREKSIAEGHQMSPHSIFKQIGFEDDFQIEDDASIREPRAWDEYTLRYYAGGRLVRLEDRREASPLRIGSKKANRQISYTPYFAFIQGRLVVAR